jgi:hypothetical protein
VNIKGSKKWSGGDKPLWNGKDATDDELAAWVDEMLEAEVSLFMKRVKDELERLEHDEHDEHALARAVTDAKLIRERIHAWGIADAEHENNFEILESLASGSLLQFLIVGVNPMPVGSMAMNYLVDCATGKAKGRRGKPGPSTYQRFLDPIREIVCEMIRIEKLFRIHFPRGKARRDRALAIAAKRGGIKEKTLRNRLKKQPLKEILRPDKLPPLNPLK